VRIGPAFDYDIGKISAGCLVFSLYSLIYGIVVLMALMYSSPARAKACMLCLVVLLPELFVCLTCPNHFRSTKVPNRDTKVGKKTSSSAMAERPRELDQRYQMGGQFEAIID